MVLSFFLLLFLSMELTAAHRILFLSPISTRSHTNFVKPVIKGLVERGHFVTYWNGLLPTNQGKNALNQTANLRLLYSPELDELNSDHNVDFGAGTNNFYLLFELPKRVVLYCKTIYRDPVFHQLMESHEKYDLIIVEAAVNECILPLVHKFDAPFIYTMGSMPMPWHLDAVSSPLAFDHYSHIGSAFKDEMNFWQRTYNALSGISAIYYWRWIVMPVADRLAAETLHIENLPTIEMIENKYLSLLILNTNLGINYQMATTPAVIQAGGMNLGPSKPLPHDLEKFVNDSGDAGCIIVSFGSLLRTSDLPDDVRRLFMSTFARLPQRILWKWENENKIGNKESIPANVKLMPWLPQADLLGHPKMRLFITHGGINSIQEAVYHKVPLIILPVFIDQPLNAKKAEDDGFAIHLDWNNLTEEILFNAIEQILINASYAEKIKKVSELVRDQMETPLDRVIYWIEYVIRHDGAPHLRTASRKLSLHQRFLFDVMLFVVLIAILMSYVFVRVLRYFCCADRIQKCDLKKKN
ncbi:UDP-glycosyltransferase UGT5-like [Daphnia carinata]|uniref:UDP-glycosyltransferase UGT5-like n=1 Tax=Daphnia carinata TaxID=120202 RepID=UPI00257DD0C8|nr:UDP-glycosyltransferase UGT5-like [Daphnia carinata]